MVLRCVADVETFDPMIGPRTAYAGWFVNDDAHAGRREGDAEVVVLAEQLLPRGHVVADARLAKLVERELRLRQELRPGTNREVGVARVHAGDDVVLRGSHASFGFVGAV